MNAIQTRYAGCLFRSRLEARWAVFFDALGIEWEYEKEGFNLGEAGLYLPDFWLPPLNAWFEVKGPPPTPEDEAKIHALTSADHNLFLAVGNIPDPTKWDFSGPIDRTGEWYAPGLIVSHYGGSDAGYCWCSCNSGKHFEIHYEGRGGRIKCDCNAAAGLGDRCHSADSAPILNAYIAARSARFEHGQSGRVL